MFRYSPPDDAQRTGFAMVADRFALLVDAAVGDELATGLWNAMTAPDAAFEDVLSLIAAVGIGRLPDFALVELVDAASSSVSVAVRGTATIDLHGPQRSSYAGSGVGTWVEGSAQHVAGISLGLAGVLSSAVLLPLGRGVARANALEWGVVVSPAPAVPAAATARSVADDVDDVDDSTVLGSRRPGASLPVPQAPHARRYVLRLTPGGEHTLERPVVLGRAPRTAQHPGARTVAVASPRKEVSGEHLEARLEGDALVLRDLGSTNGTVVRQPDGGEVLLRGGASARVAPGTVLDLGDGVTVVFEAVP
ncbi:FHA domain-containing protein [Microbacterium oleivorans]|uniref:FHA domain-containing protein n=1 Tax=Microbacterium oleivorans TaxID=273677 RepID=A0A7D5IRQ3_9MICO|nr:FHA domain-containing protein [Microbacterium oleivorans]QLD10694.1 FHA domain-containing protein [Microbacterium oleivorans]